MRLEDRFAAFEVLNQQISACTACPLHEHRLKTISGAGSIGARIIFIEDFPILEHEQADPRWSKAALPYFERLLNSIKLRREDVFVTPVIKCALAYRHRPRPAEIAACQQHLEQEIDLIDPLMIVTLGRTSAKLFFRNVKFRQLHGQAEFEDGRVYYPMFHPIAALRNKRLERMIEADFKRIPQLLEMARQGDSSAWIGKPLTQRRLI